MIKDATGDEKIDLCEKSWIYVIYAKLVLLI